MSVGELEVREEVERRTISVGRLPRLLRLIRKKPVGAVAAALVVIMVVVALSAGWVAPNDPYKQFRGARLSAAGYVTQDGTTLLLGGDEIGRDLFSRILFGARISLQVGIVAISIGTLSGSIIGLLSGYLGGKVDLVMQRIMDAQMSIPLLILAMLLVAVLPKFPKPYDLVPVMLAIGMVQIPTTNRVVRGTVLSAKQNVYVDAARVIGAAPLRIMFRHILPNVTAPIIIIATTSLGGAILIEASLSFLGVGTQPPNPSWGLMLSGAGREFMIRKPVLLIGPGVAITLAVLAFNLAGDALRDIWDPRLRGSR